MPFVIKIVRLTLNSNDFYEFFWVVVVNTGQYSEVCWVYAAHAFPSLMQMINDVYVGKK